MLRTSILRFNNQPHHQAANQPAAAAGAGAGVNQQQAANPPPNAAQQPAQNTNPQPQAPPQQPPFSFFNLPNVPGRTNLPHQPNPFNNDFNFSFNGMPLNMPPMHPFGNN